MASSKEYRDFIIDQLSLLGDITSKPMMGEFLLYHEGLLFGGIYDDRLLVKMTAANRDFSMPEELPYEGARPMYHIEDVDDREHLKEIVLATCSGLPKKKK